jgi:enoyl-CoA hydratase/carnithine racemase
MESEGVIREDRDGIAFLTLNRPQQYNTLSGAVIDALAGHLDAIAQDGSIRVIVIRSTGKAFSTGHDLKEMHAHRDKAFLDDLFARCAAMFRSLPDLPQPVIAQVQGIATAAGCQLVAACDLAIAAKSARFATSGIRYGIFCATPAVALSRTVARKHALEMLFTGDFISADRAAEIGLVNHVVDDGELEEATGQFASRIAAHPDYSLRLGKSSFYRQAGLPLDQAYCTASDDIVDNLLSADGEEGLEAFAEKRSPVWRPPPQENDA